MAARGNNVLRIDTVPLPEEKAEGSLRKIGSKYYLRVGGHKRVVPVGCLISEADIKPLVGKAVTVAYSKKQPSVIVALGPWPGWNRRKPTFKCVLCYFAPDRVIHQVEDRVRVAVINELMKNKILSKQLGKVLIGGLR